ncbi:MAG: chemotaxis response regulator CheY [Treponemataceae bacterium]|nr:MAG: chemotaxis response regulator CheY [Treponemataceae bacterium]
MITVLIVDDSRVTRNIVKNTFLELNIPCQFVEAVNGKEALKALTEQKIGLVLLDWNMPELSGLDFLQTVRAIEVYKDLPIIMVTSVSSRFNVLEALKSGATDYIVKPVSERQFKEKMKKLQLEQSE